jgi:hypothetical protein
MSGKDQSYRDGFETACSVLEWDELTVREIIDALDPDRDREAQRTPWKRGYRAAIRAAFGI